MSSLRNKILSAYGYSKLAMLAFAIVVFLDLFYLKQQIETGQVVTDFREVTLEMRRIEKNLFLYRDTTSYDQLMAQIEAAGIAFAKGRIAFQTIIGRSDLQRIEWLLGQYRAALVRYPIQDRAGQAAEIPFPRLAHIEQHRRVAGLDMRGEFGRTKLAHQNTKAAGCGAFRSGATQVSNRVTLRNAPGAVQVTSCACITGASPTMANSRPPT